MFNLQDICNAIIIIGAVVVAIKNIAEWFGKPIRLFKKKTDANFEEKVVTIIKREMPEILYEHDLEVKKKYLADRQTYLLEIKEEVLRDVKGELGQVATLATQYEALVISAKDVLREKIMQVYFKNRRDRTMTFHEKEALDQYYKDYKAIKGNSYIDRYYNRMKLWDVIPDEDED